MAGMFYSLQEVIQKLGKNEAEIKVLVKEGKLREFRDGAKQLYKTEDVDALVGSAKGDTAVLDDSLQISIDENADVSLAPEELDALMGTEKENKAQDSKFKLDETGQLLAEESLGGSSKNKSAKPQEDEVPLAPAADGTKAPSDSISIAADSAQQESQDDVSSGDTKISLSGDSINVLNESDSEFKISEDSSGKTKMVAKGAKALDDKGGDAGRLDEDVNLDAGGSGSGLLDLSMQADDTSLGAVLDDIYPESPNAASPAEPAPAAEGAAVTDDADKMLEPSESAPGAMPEEVIPQEVLVPTAAAATFEPSADAGSNIFGLILFVPLVAMIYTTIIVVSGYRPISNFPILSAVEPIIWYVAAGAAALVIVAVLIGSVSGGPKKPKAPKAPKPPKVKKVKPPKEKKGKKGAETPPAQG